MFACAAQMFIIGSALAARKRWRLRNATFRRVVQAEDLAENPAEDDDADETPNATFRRVVQAEDPAEDDDADKSGGDDDDQGGGSGASSERRLQRPRDSIRADPQLAADPTVQAALRKAEAEVFYQRATRSDGAKASTKKKRTKEQRGRARGRRGPGEDWL